LLVDLADHEPHAVEIDGKLPVGDGLFDEAEAGSRHEDHRERAARNRATPESGKLHESVPPRGKWA